MKVLVESFEIFQRPFCVGIGQLGDLAGHQLIVVVGELTYQIDDNPIITETLKLASPFKSHTAINYTFENKLDLSTPDLYTVRVKVNFDPDPRSDNNELDFTIISGSLSEFPYNQDFEEGKGGWVSKVISRKSDW